MFERFHKDFPDDFLWGASTSAYQVEGGITNDWSEWEKENANRLALESYKKFGNLKNWESIKREATDPSNYISGTSTDHYTYYREDIKLLKGLGLNSYRFSIEWSRIEPTPGNFDQKEIEHYQDVVRACREEGIEPMVTLWHFTNPIWVRDMGGWTNPKVIDHFLRYVELMVTSLPSVKYWIVVNEPELYARFTHIFAYWPPAQKNLLLYFRSVSILVRATKRAARIIHDKVPGSLVSIASHYSYIQAYNDKWYNHLFKKFAIWWWNFSFLDRVIKDLDFVGINYYFHARLDKGIEVNRNDIVSDLGWELYPKGMYYVLRDVWAKYHKPIIITEHGLADRENKRREWYVEKSLLYARKAIKLHGVEMRGYYHWSLLDNFEWDKGYWPRFGLVEVDYESKKRLPRT